MPTRLVWRCTTTTYQQAMELLRLLEFEIEGTPTWETLVDQLRSLPGCPRALADDTFTVFEITDRTRVRAPGISLPPAPAQV